MALFRLENRDFLGFQMIFKVRLIHLVERYFNYYPEIKCDGRMDEWT
jgi:hypothetical protein